MVYVQRSFLFFSFLLLTLYFFMLLEGCTSNEVSKQGSQVLNPVGGTPVEVSKSKDDDISPKTTQDDTGLNKIRFSVEGPEVYLRWGSFDRLYLRVAEEDNCKVDCNSYLPLFSDIQWESGNVSYLGRSFTYHWKPFNSSHYQLYLEGMPVYYRESSQTFNDAVYLLATYNNLLGLMKQKASYDAFAKCITEKGLDFYGAGWCSHCQRQKQLFGEAMKYINYIECDARYNGNPSLCA